MNNCKLFTALLKLTIVKIYDIVNQLYYNKNKFTKEWKNRSEQGKKLKSPQHKDDFYHN